MIFYLPIYKLKKKELEGFVESEAIKEIDDLCSLDDGVHILDSTRSKIRSRHHDKYGLSWEQNRAVGWVKVCCCTGGFSFFIGVSNSINSKSPKKYFKSIASDIIQGTLHKINFSTCNNDDEVLQKFIDIFESFVAGGPFIGCYVDYAQIESVYKYVDWKALINSGL
jgi:hypothetical protein